MFLEKQSNFLAFCSLLVSENDFLQKIIILSVVLSSNKEHNLHSNILVDNETSFDDYYHFVCNELDKYNTLQYGYHNEEIIRYVIKAWNVDNKKNLKISHDFIFETLNFAQNQTKNIFLCM